MNIAMYVPSWPPGTAANGIVTYAGEIVPALRQLGHQVYVVTSSAAADNSDPFVVDLRKIDVDRSPWVRLRSRILPDRSAFDFAATKILKALVAINADRKIDVVEIEESFGWSAKIADARLFPTVVRLHGPWFINAGYDSAFRASDRRRIRREGRGIRAASLITAPSADILKRVRAFYRSPLLNARVIMNPANPVPADNAWHLGKCDINRLLYVGRFDRRKGGDLVLRAFNVLASDFSALRLTFVGPDTGIQDVDGKRWLIRDFIQETVAEPYRDRIDFLGQLSQDQVMSLRNQHLLAIVASQFEILPYSVLEAMSVGCPIVASEVGGIPELIENRKNGLLFRSGDLAGLVSACRSLLMNHELAAHIGAQARKDTFALRTPEITAATIEAYQNAIENFHGTGVA